MSDRPLRALRRFCLECQGGHLPSVTACRDVDCLLYALRCHDETAGEPESGDANARCGAALIPPAKGACSAESPVRAIRRFCMACGGNRADVRTCDTKETCPLWSYRFGVLPSTFKRVLARQRRSRGELILPGLSNQ